MVRDALKLAGKDLRLMYRDRGAIIVGYSTILLLVVFGIIYSGMSGGNENVKVDLLYVDKEQSDQSHKFFDSLKSTGVFQITTSGSGSRALRQATKLADMILNGKGTIALVYEQTNKIEGIESLGMPVLTLYYDPSAGMERNITKGLVNQAVFMSMGSDLWAGSGLHDRSSRAEGHSRRKSDHRSDEQLAKHGVNRRWVNGSGSGGNSGSMMGHIVDLKERKL